MFISKRFYFAKDFHSLNFLSVRDNGKTKSIQKRHFLKGKKWYGHLWKKIAFNVMIFNK